MPMLGCGLVVFDFHISLKIALAGFRFFGLRIAVKALLRSRWSSLVAIAVLAIGGKPPEGDASGKSDHSFFHVQPITSVRKPGGGAVSLENGDLHVCEHFPTFPLDAWDGLDLVDAMFGISLWAEVH